MVVVKNRIEDEVVASDGLSAIDGVDCEQQNIARSEMSAHHRKSWSIAISNRTRRRNEDTIKNTDHNASIIVRSDTDTWCEPCINGKLRRVFTSNQQTTLFNKSFQMRKPVIAQSLTHIRC